MLFILWLVGEGLLLKKKKKKVEALLQADAAMNFYKQAADILDRLGKKEGSIKGLTLGNAEVTDKKRMYAVICETLKRKTRLDETSLPARDNIRNDSIGPRPLPISN